MISRFAIDLTEYDNESRDKEKLAVICGVHGNESNAVKVTSQVYKNIINDEELKYELAEKYSSITFHFGINERGLIANTRNFIEHEEIVSNDINRQFNFDDAAESMLAVKKNIESIISCNSIILDVHNSPMCKSALYLAPGKRLSKQKETARNYDIPYIVSSECNNGVIKNYINSTYDSNFKVGLTLELNGMGITSQKELDYNEDLLLKVIQGGADFLGENEETISNLDLSSELYSPAKGLLIFNRKKELIRSYYRSEVIAMIEDYEGNIVGKILAPSDGYLASVRNSVFVDTGTVFGTFMEDDD